MNSRFDQAVEQILNEHVVEEAAPGMASAPGAQPEKKGDGLAWRVTKGLGKGLLGGLRLGYAAAKPIASVAAGFTPTGIDTGIGAVKKTARGISNVAQGKEWGYQPPEKPEKSTTTTTTQPGQASAPATGASTAGAGVQPGSTALRNLAVQSQTINNLSKQFGGSSQEQTRIKAALTTMLPARAGMYRSQIPVSNVWTAVGAAADNTQRGSYTYADVMKPANIRNFETNLQMHLRNAGVDNNDINKLKRDIPAFLQTIPAATPRQNVDAIFTSLG